MRARILTAAILFAVCVSPAIAKHPDPADFPMSAKVTDSKLTKNAMVIHHSPTSGFGDMAMSGIADADTEVTAEINGNRYVLRGKFALGIGTYRCRIVKKNVQFLVPIEQRKESIVIDFHIANMEPITPPKTDAAPDKK